jgi:hypothetical protein
MKNSLKSFIFLALLSIFSVHLGTAQDEALLNKKFKKWERNERSKMSQFRQKVSLDLQASAQLMEMFFSAENNVVFENTNGDELSYLEKTNVTGFFSVAVSPRINFYEDGNKAFGLRTSMGVSFSIVQNKANYMGDNVGHLTYSASGFFAYGLGGAYNNISPNGVLFGLGLMGIRAPLSKVDAFEPDGYELKLGSESFQKTNWVLPMLNIDFYRKLGFSTRIFNYNLNFGYWRGAFYYKMALGLAF